MITDIFKWVDQQIKEVDKLAEENLHEAEQSANYIYEKVVEYIARGNFATLFDCEELCKLTIKIKKIKSKW